MLLSIVSTASAFTIHFIMPEILHWGREYGMTAMWDFGGGEVKEEVKLYKDGKKVFRGWIYYGFCQSIQS